MWSSISTRRRAGDGRALKPPRPARGADRASGSIVVHWQGLRQQRVLAAARPAQGSRGIHGQAGEAHPTAGATTGRKIKLREEATLLISSYREHQARTARGSAPLLLATDLDTQAIAAVTFRHSRAARAAGAARRETSLRCAGPHSVGSAHASPGSSRSSRDCGEVELHQDDVTSTQLRAPLFGAGEGGCACGPGCKHASRAEADQPGQGALPDGEISGRGAICLAMTDQSVADLPPPDPRDRLIDARRASPRRHRGQALLPAAAPRTRLTGCADGGPPQPARTAAGRSSPPTPTVDDTDGLSWMINSGCVRRARALRGAPIDFDIARTFDPLRSRCSPPASRSARRARLRCSCATRSRCSACAPSSRPRQRGDAPGRSATPWPHLCAGPVARATRGPGTRARAPRSRHNPAGKEPPPRRADRLQPGRLRPANMAAAY